MRFTTLILRNLMRRGVRTVLTVVGLGIAIAAVVALLGVSWGFERSFLQIYEAKGIDLIVVRAGGGDRLTSNLETSISEKLKQIRGVREVAGSLTDVVSFEEANLVSVLINGWEPGTLPFRGIRILSGRTLEPIDQHAAMLGRVLAMNLNKKVGDSIKISGEPFHVIAIFESDSLFENGGLIIKLADLQKMMGREGYLSGFLIAAADPSSRAVEELKARTEQTIPSVAAVPARNFVESDLRIRLARSMAWATSIIAIVLGSVGVLNTMMMSVFERTVEIGLLRALGWRRKRILALILGESVALGSLGALAGLLLGYLAIRALALSPTSSAFITTKLPPEVLGAALAIGVFLSLLGGVYPALRGAALEPTEALRHE
jgi:putative ABC transport system permease protein